MAAHHCFTIAVLFPGILSIARAISVPYEDIHLAFPTRFVYTASESEPAFSGYSYATQDLNGGGSNVVFATGADFVSKLKKAMNPIYEADAMLKMPEKYPQRDTDGAQDNNQENPASPGQQSKSEIEAIMNKQEDLVLNDVVSDQERKPESKNPEIDGSAQHRAPSQGVPFVHVPYPAFGANFLNLQLPTVLPRYHVSSNLIQSQYYPYNPYAHLPPSLQDFDLYNPSVPLFYQAPIAASQVPVNSLSHSSTVVKDMRVSAKANITENSRTNTTQSANSVEPNTIESRSNSESMGNKIDEASSIEPASSTFESVTMSEGVDEEMTTESAKPTVKPGRCGDQIVTTEASSTEFAHTEESTSTKEPSTETPTLSTTEM